MSLNDFRTGIHRITEGGVGKWILFIVGGLLAFSLVFSGLGNNFGPNRGAAANGATNGTAPLATVNGVPITQAEYQPVVEAIRRQQAMVGQTVGVAQSAALHSYTLDKLIDAKLQLQEAQRRKITVSNDEITKAREQAVQNANYRQALGLPPTASLSDVDAALAKAGAAPLEQRLPDDDLRQAVLLEKLQKSLSPPPTDSDLRASFKQYHTQHILIDNKKRSDDQAKVQAAQILKKAQTPGADFGALARQYSDDPGTKAKGGDDGWIDQSTGYVPEFKTAAFSLQPGQVTPDPVHVPQFGYFVIKLAAVRDNLPKDFDKNKAQYLSEMQARQSDEKGKALIDSLKNAPTTKIVVTDPALRADRTMTDAGRESDVSKKNTLYKSAVADYQAALKDSSLASTQKGEINAQLATAYEALKEKPQAIAAYQAAADATDDPNLRLTLGNLYVSDKQNDKAVQQFQAASKEAWDDQTLHTQILVAYLQMKRPDLVAEEKQWLSDYRKRLLVAQALQKTPAIPPPGAPGITAKPTPGITVKPTSGQPAPPTPKPGQ